jgi:hypothetical protein
LDNFSINAMEADMAIISPAFVTTFDVMVKQAFQGMQSLAGTCRERMNVEGTTHKFPKLAKGAASQRIPQTDVTPINAAYSSVSVTLEDWNAAEYSDIFNQAKVNFDDVRELSQVVGNAIGRRIDQMKIDALDAASSSLTVAKTVVTSGFSSGFQSERRQDHRSGSFARRKQCAARRSYLPGTRQFQSWPHG